MVQRHFLQCKHLALSVNGFGNKQINVCETDGEVTIVLRTRT